MSHTSSLIACPLIKLRPRLPAETSGGEITAEHEQPKGAAPEPPGSQ